MSHMSLGNRGSPARCRHVFNFSESQIQRAAMMKSKTRADQTMFKEFMREKLSFSRSQWAIVDLPGAATMFLIFENLKYKEQQ